MWVSTALIDRLDTAPARCDRTLGTGCTFATWWLAGGASARHKVAPLPLSNCRQMSHILNSVKVGKSVISRLFLRRLIIVALALTGCAGGASTGTTNPLVPPAATATAITWTWSNETQVELASPSGALVFQPWTGCYPRLPPGASCGPSEPVATLGTAILQLADQLGIVPSGVTYSATMTAQCATVALVIPTMYAITQGNNGNCVLAVSDSSGNIAVVPVSAGLPPRFFLQATIAGSAANTSFPWSSETLARGASLNVSGSVSSIGPTPSTAGITAAIIGSCATVSPTTNQGTFTVLGLSVGQCAIIVSDGATQSVAVLLTVS